MDTLKDCLTQKYNEQFYYVMNHTAIIKKFNMLFNSGR